jgi:hypothetical protein
VTIGIDPRVRCTHGNTFKWECPHCYRETEERIAALVEALKTVQGCNGEHIEYSGLCYTCKETVDAALANEQKAAGGSE